LRNSTGGSCFAKTGLIDINLRSQQNWDSRAWLNQSLGFNERIIADALTETD
jgi:hypothetical protein